MHGDVVLAVAAVLAIGVAAQYLGWRLKVPAIVFLLGAGLVAGPLTGWIEPDELFGDLLFPFVNLAVAVILFEGALGLRVSRLRSAGRTVLLLLSVGATLTFVLTAVVGHQVLQIPWSLAWLISGVLIVTGPTVIGPLVQSLGLKGRVASILEAEGTLIDPLGAIVTVLVFQAFYEESGASIPSELLWTMVVGTGLGLLGAGLLTVVLGRFLVPDDLHNVTTLTTVVLVFALADAVQPEAGLVAVTAMGIAVASQSRVEVRHVLEFNETLRILFISSLFILLGARITTDTLGSIEWRNLAFVAVLVVVVRPLAVGLCTIGSGLGWRDRVFLAAVAPRGIVAAAIASIFSLRLVDEGQPGAQVLVSATFTAIACTVLLSGLGARPLARRLGLIRDARRPLVILGTNAVANQLAEALLGRDVPVHLLSLDRKEVSSARMSGLPAVHGSVLDEAVWEWMAEQNVASFVAVTANDEANAVACQRAAPVVGRRNVFRVASVRKEHAPLSAAAHMPGRLLVGPDVTYPVLAERLENGWRFRATPLTEAFDEGAYRARLPADAVVVAAVRPDGVDFAAAAQPLALRPGSVVVSLVPDAPGEVRALEAEGGGEQGSARPDGAAGSS